MRMGCWASEREAASSECGEEQEGVPEHGGGVLSKLLWVMREDTTMRTGKDAFCDASCRRRFAACLLIRMLRAASMAATSGVVGEHVGGEAGEDWCRRGRRGISRSSRGCRERDWTGGRVVLARKLVEVVAEAGVVDDVVGLGGDELGVERVLVGAGDGDLGEDGEGDGVVDGAEFGDFLVGAGLLLAEVVGGEAEDDEAAVFVLLVEGFEAGVLRGEAALGGDVDDEEDFAGVVGEGGGGAGEGGERERGEGGHGGSVRDVRGSQK